jgi:hypothetical protein
MRTYTLGGLMTAAAAGTNGKLYVAVETAARSQIAVFQDQRVVLTAKGGPTDPTIFAGYPSLTVGPQGPCVAYQKGLNLAITDGRNTFDGPPIGHRCAIRWIKDHYVCAFISQQQKRVLVLDENLAVILGPTSQPQGNDRYAALIRPDGTPVWDKGIPYSEFHSDDSAIVCKEFAGPPPATHVYLGGIRTQAIVLPAGYEPTPLLLPDRTLVVVMRGGKVYLVDPPYPFVPVGAPTKPPPDNPPPDKPGEPPVNIGDQSALVATVRQQFASNWSYPGSIIPFLTTLAQRIGQGAGLLEKSSGANVQGYAHDIICFPDGHHFDVLSDAEGRAAPSWQDKGLTDPARYRAIPGTTPPPPPPPGEPPPTTPPPTGTDLARIAGALERLATVAEKYVTWKLS